MPHDKIEVPMDVEAIPAWLSWVGSTTTCLRALGSDRDAADVAAYSGYAFHLTINDACCVSGPTCLDWSALSAGVGLACGRAVTSFVSFDCFTEEQRDERPRAHAKQVFDMVGREVAEGRPCVVWGLGIPEFGVVRGVEGEEYLCVPCGPTPERLRWDALSAPGGPAFWAFPTPNRPHRGADRFAIRRGAQAIMKITRSAKEVCGLPAYDAWIRHFEGKRANRFGNSYNTQCWAEARAYARDFLARAAERNEGVAEPLTHAHEAFVEVAAALEDLAKRFPFTQDPGEIEDDGEIEAAVGLIGKARAAEERALESMIAALATWPEGEDPSA